MKKIHIFVVLFASIICTSCDDYVNIVPKGSAIAGTLDDVNSLLEGTDSRGIGGFGNLIPEMINDNIEITAENVASLAAIDRKRNISAMYNLDEIFHDASTEDSEWEGSYSSSTRTNYILRVLGDINSEVSIAKQYKAEALTHRAFAYFWLVNIFGHHYGLPVASEAGSGIPILLAYADQSESLERASVNQVYELIVSDLTTAIPLLKASRPFVDRINKSAAQAILARVYLHMGDYEKALEQANAALSKNSSLIDYNDFDPIGSRTYIPKSIDNPEFLFFRQTYPTSAGSYPGFGVGRFSESLVAAYTDMDNDLRISKHVSTYPDETDPAKTVYNYAYTNSSSYRYASPGVTVPELLLIKAEALARTGDKDDAMTAVNTLRAKRFDAAVVAADGHLLTASDQADAIQKVIDERRREFHVTGMRFFDIKRLNALHNAGISLTRGGVTWGPNSINWAVPIGVRVIETSNGQIKQNTRE